MSNIVHGNTADIAQAATAPGIDDNKMTSLAWKVLFFVSFGWVIDAADATIYSMTLPSMRSEFSLSLTQMGMIASIFLGGTMIGSFLIPLLAEKKGRRVGMILSISLYSFFTGFVGIAQNAVTVALGRFFTGWGIGGEWPTGAAYLTEVVPPKKRAWAMGIMQAGYPVGYFLAAGIFAVFMAQNWGWRGCYFVLITPAVICIPLRATLKESPTWLKNREDLSRVSINDEPNQKKANVRELFKPKYRKSTFLATGLHLFGAIFSWGLLVWVPSALMLDFHLAKVKAAQFVMFAMAAGTVGYFAAGPSADRFGRKKVLAIYCSIGLLAVLGLNYLRTLNNVPMAWLVAMGAFIGISLGAFTVIITYTSEVYPSHIRTLGLGFSVAVGKVAAVFIPTVMGAIAQRTSVTFALLISTAIGMLTIPTIFSGPETAGRTLEDIMN
jgi:MFS family permease